MRHGSPNRLLDWTVVEQRLIDSLHCWLAVRSDGSPHVVPIDGLWFDGGCYFGGDRQPYTSGTCAAMVAQCCTWRMGSRRSSSKELLEDDAVKGGCAAACQGV